MRRILHLTCLTALFFLFSIHLSFSQTATKPSGSGTEQDPYQIANLENLQWLSETDSVWDKHFIQIADIDATPTSGWDNDSGFTPIAHGTVFKGAYNGKGHKIEGLYINRPDKWDLGLFSFISKGKIDSINLKSLIISGIELYGGGLAAENSGTINHCSASGSISGNKYLGGLVGGNYGTIKNSHSNCTVNAEATPSYSGGLAGFSNGPIEKCYSTGNVSGKDYIGGLTSSSTVTIIDCYNKGNVSGDSIIGGLVGINHKGSIANSYSTGTVSGDKKVGGLVGAIKSPSETTNSYWDTETSGMDTSREGSGRTTAEMLSDTTYLNNTWDFVCESGNGTENVWAMLDGMNDGYPILAWQYKEPVPTQKTLPEVTGQGSVTVSETPTAQDICGTVLEGTTNDPLSYDSVGTYKITWKYEDSQGNTTTQKQTVVVEEEVTGIQSFSEKSITIYPNPAEKQLTVYSETEQGVKVTITDLSGRIHIQKNMSNNEHVINVSEFTPGIYIIRLETSQSTVTKKFIKK